MMQGRDMHDVPPRDRRSPYTPTWHLQGPPSVGNAHAAYVTNIPSESTIGSRMGHAAPPPYQLVPPPPQPSGAQQLLVLTPLEQSMRGATSEAEATSVATATEGKLQAHRRINACHRQRHSWQGPMINCLCRRRSTRRRHMGRAPQMTAKTGRCRAWSVWCQLLKRWQTCRARMIGMLGLLLLTQLMTPTPISKPQLFKLRTQISRF